MFSYFIQCSGSICDVEKIIPYIEGYKKDPIISGIDGKNGVYIHFDDNKFSVDKNWKTANGYFYCMESKPKPDEIKRKTFIPGHMVKLSDGNNWEIPVARLVNGGTNLEQIMKIESGELKLKVVSKYEDIWNFAERIWSVFTAQEEPDKLEFTIKDDFNMTCKILSTNYMVSEIEVSEMEILSTMNIADIYKAIVDIPSLEIMINEIKKNSQLTEDLRNLDSGVAD